MNTKKVLIGKVTSVFGIKGEVKIISYCDDPQKIEKYDLYDKNGQKINLKISNKNKAIVGSTGSGDSILIAKITGIDDRNAAEKLRGAEIFTDREDFEELSDDEFYYVDLIGLDVIDENSTKIGKVMNVDDYGSGGVLEIDFLEKSVAKEYHDIASFPFRDQIFPEVNIKDGFIRMLLPEVVEEK